MLLHSQNIIHEPQVQVAESAEHCGLLRGAAADCFRLPAAATAPTAAACALLPGKPWQCALS